MIPRDYAFALFMTPGPEGKVWLRGEHDFGAYADGLYKFGGGCGGPDDLFVEFTAVNDYGTITCQRALRHAGQGVTGGVRRNRECSRIGVRV